MPIETIIVTASILAVFIGFGLVLNWADHQTRNLDRVLRTPPEEHEEVRRAA